jgi:hypothetical protein
MANPERNSTTEGRSLQDWAKGMRERAIRDMVCATTGQARALAQAHKPTRTSRRGKVPSDAGLLRQEIAADFDFLRALVRQLAELAYGGPLPSDERTPGGRRRPGRPPRKTAAKRRANAE